MNTMRDGYLECVRIKSSDRSLKLHLEPWGEEILILPNVSYEIRVEGPSDGCLEIEFGGERVIAYAWPGSVASVFSERNLVCACRIPAPPTPSRPFSR